jgi:hypothetical protein
LNPDEGGLYAPVRTSLFQITSGQTAAGPTAAVTFDTTTFDPLGIGASVGGVFTPPPGSYLLNVVLPVQTSANTTIELRIYKNGANTVPPQKTADNVLLGTATTVGVTGIVDCNGTDTFQIEASVGSGTWSTYSGYGMLLITPA